MLTGISTACFYPMHTEDALKIICDAKVEAAEVFVNCDYEVTRPMLRQMRDIADASGVKVLSLHPHTGPSESITFFTKYKRRFDEGLELYKKYYEAANILGANAVVFHGGAKAAPITYSEYFETFGLLVENAIVNGSNLCHENVERCISYSPDFFRALGKAVPQAEFILDVKQAVRAGYDALTFATAMGTKIKHVHFSDHDDSRTCLLPGQGIFNTQEFLNLIVKNGFNGGVLVEVYRENFVENVELFKGYQQLFTETSTIRKNAERVDIIRQIR